MASKRGRYDLPAFQRDFAKAVMRPLGKKDRMTGQWVDGRAMKDVAAEWVKATETQGSLERLEIYNRQYWYRVVASLEEDFPGVRAVIGERRFGVLIRDYVQAHPSRSFTLRNLGRRMEQFISERPELTKPWTVAAKQMAAFEWAQIECFDAGEATAVTMETLQGGDAAMMRFRLKPAVRLLAMDYPLDDLCIALGEVEREGAGSNATMSSAGGGAGRRRVVKLPRPVKRKIFLAVHRAEGRLFYKRLSEVEYGILEDLAAGKNLRKAVIGVATRLGGEAGASGELAPEALRESFRAWVRLGWLCERG